MLAGVLRSQAHQACAGTKQTKSTKPLGCTKPAQAPKRTKSQQLVRKHEHRFGIFVFFWCLCRLGDGCAWVLFWFVDACAGLVGVRIQNIGVCSVLLASSQHQHRKVVCRLGFRAPTCKKHRNLHVLTLLCDELE